MTFDELCKIDNKLLSLYQEAGAYRVLLPNGTPGRTFAAERAQKLSKDPNFCKYKLWHGLPQARGEVGLKYLAEQRIEDNDALKPHYTMIMQRLEGAIPGCQHDGDACCSDFPVPPPTTELGMVSWARERGQVGFADVRTMMLHAAGAGPAPDPNKLTVHGVPELVNGSQPVPNDLMEPVFIVRTEQDAWRLSIAIHLKDRLEAKEISRWYARNCIYVCGPEDAKRLHHIATIKSERIVGGLGWKPVVLTFTDPDLERSLSTKCVQVVTVPYVEDKDHPGELWDYDVKKARAAIKDISKIKPTATEDMPSAVLDGWLGKVCRERMSAFPIAYSWPALLTVASVLMVTGTRERVNLFCGLVGPVGSGKTEALRRAFHLMRLLYMENGSVKLKLPAIALKAGSAEGMAEKIGDLQGAPRLVFVDELAHLMVKVNYEGSSFESFLDDAYTMDYQPLTVSKRKQIEFNCRLSLAGGIPEEKFEEAFGSGTVGGLHNRFIFGLCPSTYSGYNYRPNDDEPALEPPPNDEFSITDQRPQAVSIDPSVWVEQDRWKNELNIGGRARQAGIKAAIIAAAFDGREVLRGSDLGPALEFAKYQDKMQTRLAPNPGKNDEAIFQNKLVGWLRAHTEGDQWHNERSVLKAIHSERFSASTVKRSLEALCHNGEIERDRSGRHKLIRLNPEVE